MVNKSVDSNLFSINLEEIENIITDANIELLKKFDELMSKFNSIPEKITNEDQNKQAKQIVSDIKAIMNDFKKARLQDGRPFTDATKIIKNWFNLREYELKKNLNDLNNRVSDFLLNTEEIETEEEIITPLRKEVPVIWSVASFNREEINLDEIKIYLTDFAIQKAIEKHLQIHGPNKLIGVSYEKKAVI